MITGYRHPRYAASLAEFGTPYRLPQCEGWILKRKILDFPCYDGMGCYPLFACRHWTKLPYDLEDIRGSLIGLSLVTDPFGEYDAAHLRRCFKDGVIPFKKHYTVSCRSASTTNQGERR